MIAATANDEACDSIKVAIRVKPLVDTDSEARSWDIIPETNSVVQVTDVQTYITGRTSFMFDETFGENATTKQVYEGIAKKIVNEFLTGHNGTIFAYGQTNSGKTYTMQGGDTLNAKKKLKPRPIDMGIAQLSARDIFAYINKAADRDFLIRTSYIEIYNEQVRDLLANDNKHHRDILMVREDRQKGVFVDNCKEALVTNEDALIEVLQNGSKKRAVSSTAMNNKSSRSHSIFRITMESREKGDGTVLISTLNLVDLAGSESVRKTGATGERQREGGKINQSLLSLSKVIKALGQSKRQHINFRDSNLTRILQTSLSGNSFMAMICCVTQSPSHIDESRSTLKFAERAKLVKMRPRRNKVTDDCALIKRLERELQEARSELHLRSQQLNQLDTVARKNAEENFKRLKSMIFSGGMLKLEVPSPRRMRGMGRTQNSKRNITSCKGDECPFYISSSDLSCFSVGVLHTSSHQSMGIIESREEGISNLIDEQQTIRSSLSSENSASITNDNDFAAEIAILKQALLAKGEQNRSLKAELDNCRFVIDSLRNDGKKKSETKSSSFEKEDAQDASTATCPKHENKSLNSMTRRGIKAELDNCRNAINSLRNDEKKKSETKSSSFEKEDAQDASTATCPKHENKSLNSMTRRGSKRRKPYEQYGTKISENSSAMQSVNDCRTVATEFTALQVLRCGVISLPLCLFRLFSVPK